MFGVGAIPALAVAIGLRGGAAAQRRKKILVAIFQRGAVDGLNMVVPFGEPRYYELRPTIAIPRPDGTADTAVDLDGFFGLHPSLAPLKPLLRRAPVWRSCTRWDRPTRRARTSTRRTTWNPARPA